MDPDWVDVYISFLKMVIFHPDAAILVYQKVTKKLRVFFPRASTPPTAPWPRLPTPQLHRYLQETAIIVQRHDAARG